MTISINHHHRSPHAPASHKLASSSFLSPPSSPSSSLRIGTFNVGLGFQRKLPDITSRSHSLLLDIIGLQEIGDPALLTSKLNHYFLIASPGPSNHQAGVGLLIAHYLTPYCRAYKRSTSGRLIGVILELIKGKPLLIISAYMPSGLDHQSLSSDSHTLAHELYTEIISWSHGTDQVIVVGDLNQTLTSFDRNNKSSSSLIRSLHSIASSPIQCLPHHGFTDVYRTLHSNASVTPGYTHQIKSVHSIIQSRIDYIWTKGYTMDSLVQIHIDSRLHDISHHHLLWMDLKLHMHSSLIHDDDIPLYQLQLPNVRDLTVKQKELFSDHLDTLLSPHEAELNSLSLSHDPSSLDTIASTITSITRSSAFKQFPLTGSSSHHTKQVLHLQRQRRALISLINVSTKLYSIGVSSFTHSPEWLKQYHVCSITYKTHWSINLFTHSHMCDAWLRETRQLIRHTRTTIRQLYKHMSTTTIPPFAANPSAIIHRMLDSNALPSQIYSVIDSQGELTTTPKELQAVMVQHFESVFSVPVPTAPIVPLLYQHHVPPSMLYDKPNIESSWYDSLMIDVTESELLTVLSDTPLVAAPGIDEVSTGVWKIAIQGNDTLRSLVTNLFSSCLQTSHFPISWKNSIILPLVKDSLKERTMKNIRPISLQSCLGKLFNKLIAYRLGRILIQYPILNTSQRGFVLGGTTVKCIDELIDAWDWSKKDNKGKKNELYTLFYDIAQAYDSVQINVLVRSLQRIHLPLSFITLIKNSLTNLTSCVRTIYGLSRSFLVQRSLRQGDPLAPLLFVILMDALHDGLHTNPFTLQQHGLKFNSNQHHLPSLGYADDTTVLTNSIQNLYVQNEWVKYFMHFNLLKLNFNKCELVGRLLDGSPLTHSPPTITIDGHQLVPISHTQPIRYLGAHSCFDGNWTQQQNKCMATIQRFTRTAIKFNLSVSQTIYMFNVFLLSKLELPFHYVHGPGTTEWIKNCDRTLIGCIKHIVSSPIRLSHSVLALTLHLNLPSWLETTIKISELFLRMNSQDTRWGHIGRSLMRQQCSSTVNESTPLHTLNTGTRLTRAALLACRVLNWSIKLDEHHHGPRAARHQHLFSTPPLPGIPTMLVSTSSPQLRLIGPMATNISHDIFHGWGTTLLPINIHTYSDGSYDPSTNTSSWAVVLGDDWLLKNFRLIPSDETLVRALHVIKSSSIYASIACTVGVYPAELQGIIRILAMFPLTSTITIHTDSKSSIDAISAYDTAFNERKRLRMASRPLLQLIHHLTSIRKKSGGSVEFMHVKAHSDAMDLHSVGNRIADFQANKARKRVDLTQPITLQPLPLHKCEHFLHMIHQPSGKQLIDDIRRSSLLQLKSANLQRWCDTYSSSEHSYFSDDRMISYGRIVLRFGSAMVQSTFVHVVTNSIHFHWVKDLDGVSTLQKLTCNLCKAILSIPHLIQCPGIECESFRQNILSDFKTIFSGFRATESFFRSFGHLSLKNMLKKVFPTPNFPSPTVESVHRHFSFLLIGAFTSSHLKSALKVLGLDVQVKESHLALREFRLKCLSNIGYLYAAWKAQFV